MDRIEKIFCVILASGIIGIFHACIYPFSSSFAGLASARNTTDSANGIVTVQDTTGQKGIKHVREAVPFGDFEQWKQRRIKESAIVGKDSVTVYEIGKEQVIHGNIPYINKDSPWATSNAFAKVMGIVKTNVNVRPAPHDTPAKNSSTGKEGDRCAEMKTEIMSFKVLGMANVNVLTAGAIYLGKLKEPINSMDNAIGSVNIGIPFTKMPKYLVFDYKATIRNSGTVSKSTGMKRTDMPGKDKAIVTIQLQKRMETDGKIYAERVATGEMLIDSSCDWKHGVKLKLEYGRRRMKTHCRNFHSSIHFSMPKTRQANRFPYRKPDGLIPAPPRHTL